MAISVWGGVSFGNSAAQKLKRIIDKYPGNQGLLYVTSAYRPGDNGSYHGQVLTYGGSEAGAVDIGFGYPNNGAEAYRFARWLYQYSGYLVELIHANSRGGSYVKNQTKVGPYAVADHWNHIHVAISSSLADQLLKKLGDSPSGPSRSQVAVTPWNKRPVVQRGDSGGAVGHIQYLLRDRLGYTIDKFNNYPFGPQTEAAVIAFQKKYGLIVDGIVGPQTWSWAEVKGAQAVSVGKRPLLQRGDEGQWTGYAQHALRKGGYSIDDLQGFPFGPQTERAVISLQQKYDLLVDGIIGDETWDALDAVESGRKVNPDPTPPPPDADYSAPDFFVPREDWGAHPAKAVQDVDLGYWKGITVHHSAGDYTTPKNIQEWMMFNRPEAERLADIGYSFLVYDGKMYVGRGFYVRPAHDGINTTLGVCMIGSYQSNLPSQQDLAALVEGIRQMEDYVGRSLPVDRHRDRGQTSCPGDSLASWVINKLPGELDPTPTPPPPEPEPEPEPGSRVVQAIEHLEQALSLLRQED